MKTSFLILIIFLGTLIFCHHDQELNTNGIYHTWEAKSFISLESVTYPKIEGNKILLTFNESGYFQLKLDINSCGGTFVLGKNNQIEIESPACTEACCDSKFSEKLATMVSKVTSFNIEGKTMKLNVPQWGYINLELAE